MSIYSIITVAVTGACTGLFNMFLAKAGYVAPDFINGETVAYMQSASVQHTITFFFVGLEIITSIIVVVLLAFINVEKGLDKKQAEIAARKQKA